MNLNKLFGMPVLVAIHVADTARQLEALTDEQARPPACGHTSMQPGSLPR